MQIVQQIQGRSSEEVEWKAKKAMAENFGSRATQPVCDSQGWWRCQVVIDNPNTNTYTMETPINNLPTAIKQMLELLAQFNLAEQNQILKATREQVIAQREEQAKGLEEQLNAVKDSLDNL